MNGRCPKWNIGSMAVRPALLLPTQSAIVRTTFSGQGEGADGLRTLWPRANVKARWYVSLSKNSTIHKDGKSFKNKLGVGVGVAGRGQKTFRLSNVCVYIPSRCRFYFSCTFESCSAHALGCLSAYTFTFNAFLIQFNPSRNAVWWMTDSSSFFFFELRLTDVYITHIV